jgi:phenylacetate-CoA ligase
MTLQAETAGVSQPLREEIAASLRAVTKLGGNVELVSPGALPNDGKVIADER